MKVNSITNNTGSRGRAMMSHHSAAPRIRECVKERDNLKQNNYDNINTSIKSNPDARVSFKGAPILHRLAEYAHNNPLSAEAICAIFYAGCLRPLSVMAMARDESEKEKCKYQAAKSIASAYIGLFSTIVVGTIVSAGTGAALKKGAFKLPEIIRKNSQDVVDKGISALSEISQKQADSKLSEQISKFTQNGKLNLNIFDKKGENTLSNFTKKLENADSEKFEIVKKAITKQKVVDRYEDTAKNVADKLLQPIWMPIRAFMTVELVTPIVNYFGFFKPSKNPEKIQQDTVNSIGKNVSHCGREKEVFQPFYKISEAK